MVLCGNYRKERTATHGQSNRTKEWKPAEQTGPLDFDQHARATAPQLMNYKIDMQVPANNHHGGGNQDFDQKLPGKYVQMPMGDPSASKTLKKQIKTLEQTIQADKTSAVPHKIVAPVRGVNRDEEKPREVRVKGHKVAPRWHAGKFFQAPHYTQAPLQKEEGNVWNSHESFQVQGDIKGQDRLMRTVRRPEDVGTPESGAGARRHPLDGDKEEYYPGRDDIDAVADGQPGNDFAIRPIHLPDFFNPPPEHGDSVMRMQRIREVIKQRYAGRPRLIGVFKNCSLTKPGFVFPRDMQQVFDQMGIKVSPHEAELLIKAVDKDNKGAISFDEFADLIYGDNINIGGAPHEPQERHVRHVTKTLVENLISSGQALGKAFCEIDPERRYQVSKDQFANALGTASNHISNQAIEFLWASQFQGMEGQDVDSRCIDWRSFMSQLAHFASEHRAPTPCCVQGKKRQYDLLQRTAALTGGMLTDEDFDLNRPDQNADDTVCIVADQMVHRASELPHQPRNASFLTPHYVDDIRIKALRVERALPERISKQRMKELLQNRQMVHQEELIQLIGEELDNARPNPLSKQEPLYASAMPSRIGNADVMTLDPKSLADPSKAARSSPVDQSGDANDGATEPGPAALKLVKADIQAFASAQRHNRDHEIDVNDMIEQLYQPMHEKKQMVYVNDGLNRQRRGLRPGRERPPHAETKRHENYWQARYVMEQVNEAIANVESSNGGKIKPSAIFKRLDFDNDGYISLSDIKSAFEKYKIPHQSSDIHAMFSEIDRFDEGSVDIGEFTRHYEVHQGTMLDNMQKPIKAVKHEGGVHLAGPVQEMLDDRDKKIAEGNMPGNLSSSDKAGGASASGAGYPRSESAPASERAGSTRSGLSSIGRSIAGSQGVPTIYAGESGEGHRISDVIRSRVNAWKPQKHEYHTSMPRTRFGMTCYPDTRHCTEHNMPLSSAYLADEHRFKTTNSVKSIFAVPDHRDPQTEDKMRGHARNEFKVERIRQRQRDFTERCGAANEAAREFDELKVARKAMNTMNYERKCSMACA